MWCFSCSYVFLFQNCTSKCVQPKLLKHSGNGIQWYGNTFFLQQGDLCFQSFRHVCLSQSQHCEALLRKQTQVEVKTELMEIKIGKKKKEIHILQASMSLSWWTPITSCVIHKTQNRTHIWQQLCQPQTAAHPTWLPHRGLWIRVYTIFRFVTVYQTIKVRRGRACHREAFNCVYKSNFFLKNRLNL